MHVVILVKLMVAATSLCVKMSTMNTCLLVVLTHVSIHAVTTAVSYTQRQDEALGGILRAMSQQRPAAARPLRNTDCMRSKDGDLM